MTIFCFHFHFSNTIIGHRLALVAMSETICSSSSSTRKRSRETIPSPDMFLFCEDDDDVFSGITVEGEDEQSGFSQTRIKRQTKWFADSSNVLLIPPSPNSERNAPSPESDFENDNRESYSMSSLISTADSNHCGLNSRILEALRSTESSSCRLEFSNDLSLSTQTPAVYTLNNNTIPTQTSIYSGDNFGLSDGVWREIQQAKGITNLYDWQIECLNKALETNTNLLYSLPTSGNSLLIIF